MEVGSCTYEGAAAKGAAGFAILQGVNPMEPEYLREEKFSFPVKVNRPIMWRPRLNYLKTLMWMRFSFLYFRFRLCHSVKKQKIVI